MSYQPETPTSDIGTDAQAWLARELDAISLEYDAIRDEKSYGGISKTTDTNYGTVGINAWTIIDNWDSGMVAVPKNVTQDVANSGIRILTAGVYNFSGDFSISFTGTNSGRTFGVRLWNATKSVAGRVVEYAVGRNQEGINLTQSAGLYDVSVDDLGDLLQIQIAGISASFSSVAVVDGLFSATRSG